MPFFKEVWFIDCSSIQFTTCGTRSIVRYAAAYNIWRCGMEEQNCVQAGRACSHDIHDIMQRSPTAQYAFRPMRIPGLISWVRVTKRWGLLSYAQNAVIYLSIRQVEAPQTSNCSATLCPTIITIITVTVLLSYSPSSITGIKNRKRQNVTAIAKNTHLQRSDVAANIWW